MRIHAPMIHTNGTSEAALVAAYEAARAACNEAINALDATAPNGRDYYRQDYGAFLAANAEHNARVARLLHVRREIVAILEAIGDREPEVDVEHPE